MPHSSTDVVGLDANTVDFTEDIDPSIFDVAEIDLHRLDDATPTVDAVLRQDVVVEPNSCDATVAADAS